MMQQYSSATTVGTTSCVRNNSWNNSSGRYLCVEWYVEPCVAQCQCVALSRDTIRLHVCGIKQGVVSTKGDTAYRETTDARANVTRCENEIERDSCGNETM